MIVIEKQTIHRCKKSRLAGKIELICDKIDKMQIQEGREILMRGEILRTIETNSKIDVQELAVRLGTDEVSIMNELEAMENEQIICGYPTLINWDKVGTEVVKALIEVRVAPQRDLGFDKIAERIYQYPEVTAVFLISGAYDILVTIEGKTLQEISKFVSDRLSPIDSVLSTATHFILKKYKEHGHIIEGKSKAERILVTP